MLLKRNNLKSGILSLLTTSLSGVLFFLYLGHALKRSHGHLRLKHLILLSVGTLLISFAGKEVISKYSERVIYLCLLAFSLFGVLGSEVIYSLSEALDISTRILFGVSFTFVGLYIYFKNNHFLWGALASLVTSYSLTIFNSPAPVIDVWEFGNMAADYLLKGENPYAAYYPDLYKGKYDLTHGFIYWPVATYLFSAARALALDIRWSLWLMNLLAIVGFYFYAGKKSSISFLTSSILWLSFPVAMFNLEQSWVDGFLMAPLIFNLHFLKEEKYLLSAIFLGIMCMTRQYMIFYAALTFFYIIKTSGLKDAAIYTGISSSVSLALAAPFLIWDPELFIQKTVFDVMKMAPRVDSLSWSSYYLRFYEFSIPSWLSLGLSFLATSWAAYSLFKAEKQQMIGSLLKGSTVVYLVTFLFGKQAFCNYYYFVAFTLLCYIFETQLKNLKVKSEA